MHRKMLPFLREVTVVHLAPFARLLVAWRGGMKYWLQPGRRKNLMANLTAAFPTKPQVQIGAICRKVFVTGERNSLEQYRLELLNETRLRRTLDRVEIRGQEHIERAKAEGRPVILVTPHFGNFMLGALRVAADYSKNGVYFFYNPPERNTYAETSNRLLDRPANHCHKIYNNLHGIKTALKVLREQGTLCMMPDLISVTTSSLYVPFFGRFFTAMSGIAFLAFRSDAAVIPCYCYAERGAHHVMEFRPAIEVPEAPDRTAEDRTYELTAKLFQEMERQITLRPDHWRYWHVYLKRSLAFPVPPLDSRHLLTQLQGCGQMTSQDAHLAGLVDQWIAMLEQNS
jgi:Kdo2-lipid IVA lauroyltransferase/acyltransferase